MEQLFLTCLQAQLVINRVNNHAMIPDNIKTEIIMEVKRFTRKGCFIDAKAD